MACVDGQGVVVCWNSSATALFFVEEKSALGKALRDVVRTQVAIVDGARLRVERTDGAHIDVTAALTSDVHGDHTLVVFSTRELKRDPREELSPRLVETLEALLAGHSEKQIASDLGISQHTVHDYVKALYRRYGVASRAELLSLVLTRRGPT